MATVKIRFRASTVENKEGTLVYQVIHKRQTRQVSTGYKLYPQEWNMLYSTVDFPPKCTEGRRNYLAALQAKLIVDINMLKSIIVKLEHTGKDYRADDVLRLYRSPSETKGFVSFTESLIAELKRTGRQCTAERYATTLNSFKRFMAERNDIPLDLVESSLMVEYETFLKSNGICPNSISFYMRCLRAVYNRAVEKELVVQRNPFKHVYTGIDKTVKRAVPLKIIRQIRELDLTLTPELDYAKDLFLFSFYTRGMSFVDMAYLKKKNLHACDQYPGRFLCSEPFASGQLPHVAFIHTSVRSKDSVVETNHAVADSTLFNAPLDSFLCSAVQFCSEYQSNTITEVQLHCIRISKLLFICFKSCREFQIGKYFCDLCRINFHCHHYSYFLLIEAVFVILSSSH